MVRAGLEHHLLAGLIYGPYRAYAHIVNTFDMRHIPAMAETLYPVKKLVNLTDEQAAAISEFRFSQRLLSDNEAIRKLIELGLETARQRRKEKA